MGEVVFEKGGKEERMKMKKPKHIRGSIDILSCQRCSGMYKFKTVSEHLFVCDNCGDEINYTGLCKSLLFYWETEWLKSQASFTLSGHCEMACKEIRWVRDVMKIGGSRG